MTVHTASGFQAVDEIFLSLPKTVSWTETEEKRLNALYKRGHQVSFEADIVNLAFKMNKPFTENDDEIDNMLNWEAYRFEFEANNPSYLEMKTNEENLQRDILSFMEENLLFFSFAVTEMKRRLIEPYEVFNSYSNLRAVTERVLELSGILANGQNVDRHPGQLRRNYYGMA